MIDDRSSLVLENLAISRSTSMQSNANQSHTSGRLSRPDHLPSIFLNFVIVALVASSFATGLRLKCLLFAFVAKGHKPEVTEDLH